MLFRKEDFKEATFTFKRVWWKVCLRWLVLFLFLVLNYSMVAGTIAEYFQGRRPELSLLVTSFVLLLFLDLTILLPLLFEVDSVWILPDKLIMRTLLWQKKLAWQDVVSLKNPIWLNFVILKSPKCFYLLNRKDLQPFDMLVEKILEKAGADKLLGVGSKKGKG